MVWKSSIGPSCYHGSVRYGREVVEKYIARRDRNRKAEVHKQALDYNRLSDNSKFWKKGVWLSLKIGKEGMKLLLPVIVGQPV